MLANNPSRFESRALACVVFGVIDDAMGTPTENLEPADIEQRFGWVKSFEGDGTDDTILRDMIASAHPDRWLCRRGSLGRGMARAAPIDLRQQGWALFPSVLHAAAKLRHGYAQRTIAEGTMPSSTSAAAIAPVGIRQCRQPAGRGGAGHGDRQHVTDVVFCQDGAAAIAAAVAEASMPEATVDSVLEASTAYLKPWSGREMLTLIAAALELAGETGDYKLFRERYHDKFRQRISCDSRETTQLRWRSFVSPGAIRGWPPLSPPISGAILIRLYGGLRGGRYLRRPERHFTGERGVDRVLVRRDSPRSSRSSLATSGPCAYQDGERVEGNSPLSGGRS